MLLQLNELRKRDGVKMKELSEYLGVTVSTISMYESGKREPDLQTLCKLADFFHVTTDELLGRTPFTVKTGTPPEKLPDGAHKVEVTLPADAAPDRQREALQSLVREIVRQELSRRPR